MKKRSNQKRGSLKRNNRPSSLHNSNNNHNFSVFCRACMRKGAPGQRDTTMLVCRGRWLSRAAGAVGNIEVPVGAIQTSQVKTEEQLIPNHGKLLRGIPNSNFPAVFGSLHMENFLQDVGSLAEGGNHSGCLYSFHHSGCLGSFMRGWCCGREE